jgi:hypothetical protein
VGSTDLAEFAVYRAHLFSFEAMKASTVAVLMLAGGSSPALADESATNPIAKVLDLLAGLQSKIIGEGEAAQKAYDEFSEWCEDSSKRLAYEIKTSKASVDQLNAAIANEVATSGALSTKVEEIASGIATDEADLKAATAIRANEASDFAKQEKDLTEVVDTLQRAYGILEREMQKGGASMLQMKNLNNLAQAFGAMVHASMITSADASKLTALVQSTQESDDDLVGAPAATVYEGHSDGILDTLDNLREEASGQLEDSRHKETSALHNFEMLKQSLVDQLKFANKEMAETKKSLAQSAEKQATAEGDLEVTSKDLAEDSKADSDLHRDCMAKASDFEASTKSRAEELKALATAKKIISESTGGAASQSYGLDQVSFLQSRLQISSGVQLANFEAVRYVRDLARKTQSKALAQLASRMGAAMRLSNGANEDPFAKVKGLISDMLEKLENEAAADATQKAYCDKEMAESNDKKDELTTDIAKLSTKIDQMSSRSAHLKGEVVALQKALAELAASQAEMDKMRQEEKAIYEKNKPEMEQGLEGIKMALKVLRDYYASDKSHASADGAAGGIVGLLEVCESDFSKGLAEMVSTEEAAAAAYEQETKENAIEKLTKEKDAEYKQKESVGLDKAVAEHSQDRAGAQTQLDAVVEYLKKLDDMCIAKPDTYAERTRRREAELAGLKEALTILQGEAVLLQRTRSLRGVHHHAQA